MVGNVIAFRKFVSGGSMFGEEFVGLHYVRMFINDPTFWRVFKNTLMLGGLTLLFNFPLPILFALAYYTSELIFLFISSLVMYFFVGYNSSIIKEVKENYTKGE